MPRRWINSADVLMDDEGRLAVFLPADLITGGVPINVALADPGHNDWSDQLVANPINRACTRLRVVVGDSGCQISLDGGLTSAFFCPPNFCDDIPLAIASAADIRVKRLTTGTAITNLKVQVR